MEPEDLVVKDTMRDGSAAGKSRIEIMKICLEDAVLNGQRSNVMLPVKQSELRVSDRPELRRFGRISKED